MANCREIEQQIKENKDKLNKLKKEYQDCEENNYVYKTNILCEPQLGKRGLYPTTSNKETHEIVADQMNFLAYCDGSLDLVDFCSSLGAVFGCCCIF